MLTDREIALLVKMGQCEQELMGMRDALRTRSIAMVGTYYEALSTRERIDAFLSYPTGRLARSLLLFPARDADAAGRAQLVVDAAVDLIHETQALLESIDLLVRAIDRFHSLAAEYSAVVPETFAKASRAGRFEERLNAITVPDSARLLLEAVDQLEASLLRQRRLYEDAAESLADAATALNIEVAPWSSDARGLETYVRELADRIQAQCDVRRDIALDIILPTARQHLSRLEADDRFVRNRKRTDSRPSHGALKDWLALRSMTPRRSRTRKRT